MKVTKDEIVKIKPAETKQFVVEDGKACNAARVLVQYCSFSFIEMFSFSWVAPSKCCNIMPSGIITKSIFFRSMLIRCPYIIVL